MRIIILSLLVWFSTTGFALADWVEARSDNFVFVGDTSEKKAKVIVEELEEYRASIFKAFGVTPVSEMVPVRIYGAKSSRQVRDMTGWEGSAGVYTTTREGPVFIANIKGGFSNKSRARDVIYHEYTHHVISTYTGTIYPRWYNEGFAEYFSTFEFDNKNSVASIGRPNDNNARWLSVADWLPMDVVLKSIRRYPFNATDTGRKNDNLRAVFYAQSWLAVHHLRTSPEYNKKLRAYFEMMNDYDVPEDAFEQAFGMTPDEYGTVLRAYYKKNRYAYAKIPFEGGYTSPPIATRTITDAEAAFHRGEAVRLFRRSDEGKQKARDYYTEALSEEGMSPQLSAQITASLALMLSLDKKGTEAIVAVAPALAEIGDDASGVAASRVLTIAGLAHFNRYSGEGRSEDDMKTARAYFMRALRAHSDNITAHYYYAASYPATTDPISKQAVYSASEAAIYYRALQFTESNMPLADILIRQNKGAEAVPMLEQARVWSRNGGVRRYATDSLRRLGALK